MAEVENGKIGLVPDAAVPAKPFVVVGIPAFNEEKTVGKVVLQSQKYADKVVVCDDGCSDLTGEIARRLGAEVVRHETNLGYGAAIQTLFKRATELGADVLVTLDGDGQHDPRDIANVVAPVASGVADIAEALRVSEKTVDRWCSVHRKYGWEGLAVKSHATHIVHRTPQATVDLVLKLRRETHWGPCKIEGYLRKHGEETASVSHTTIYRMLVEAELNRPIVKPRRVWGKRRFEREHSNSLWQADFKLTSQDEWMVSFLDDHSRFVTGSEIHHNPTGEHAIQLLEASIVKYGKPDQILTDRGTQFYPARGETSAFTEFCSGNGIEHIVASVRRPSTIGKIEVFHKAYKYEAWMFPSHPQFVNYWNYERPHQGISYLYPADVYFRDLKKGTHHSG